MFKTKLITTVCIFATLLILTSFLKNQTRIIEKKIQKINKKITFLKKDFHETQLDYSYLTSPKNLSKKIEDLGYVDYGPIDFSRIYLNYKDFLDIEKKMTILRSKNNEKIIQKK